MTPRLVAWTMTPGGALEQTWADAGPVGPVSVVLPLGGLPTVAQILALVDDLADTMAASDLPTRLAGARGPLPVAQLGKTEAELEAWITVLPLAGLELHIDGDELLVLHVDSDIPRCRFAQLTHQHLLDDRPAVEIN